jgi:hypothetical protein
MRLIQQLDAFFYFIKKKNYKFGFFISYEVNICFLLEYSIAILHSNLRFGIMAISYQTSSSPSYSKELT